MDDIDIGKVSDSVLGPVLLPLQFRPVVQRPDHAQWKSDAVTFDIIFDRTNSYELDMILTRHRGLVHRFDPFSLWQILRFKGTGAPNDFSNVQVTSTDAARALLLQMIHALVEKGPEFLSGSREAFTALRRWNARNDAAYTDGVALRGARERARRAWARQDYKAVVAALEPHLRRLTGSELKRLEIATTRLRTGSR